MSALLQNGLSVVIARMISGGMLYACPYEQASYIADDLTVLEDGAIQTPNDLHAVSHRIERSFEHMDAFDLYRVQGHLCRTNDLYREWCLAPTT